MLLVLITSGTVRSSPAESGSSESLVKMWENPAGVTIPRRHPRFPAAGAWIQNNPCPSIQPVAEYTVGVDGKVSDVALVRSSGVSEFDSYFLEDISRTRYDPSTKDGVPIAVRMRGTFAYLGPNCTLGMTHITGARITGFGIYDGSTKRNERNEHQGGGVGFHTISDEWGDKIAATAIVPCEIGKTFGFEFVVYGFPRGESISLREVTLLPSPGLKAPEASQSILRDEYPIRARIGEPTHTGWGFDYSWECVPGPWSIQLYYEDRLLAEKTFYVRVP
jgi:TonB family protein